jgi:hypothetical protein
MPEFGAPSTGWGGTMGATDMLTIAAETLRNFERHPEAMRVARWGRELLERWDRRQMRSS